MAHFPETVFLIPASVFIAGLIGSPHCVSMCGPIVINFAGSRRSMLFYQLGRLVAYMTFGALLGAFGKSILGDQQSVWFSTLSLLFIALLLIYNGYRTYQMRPLHFQLPAPVSRFSNFVWRSARLSKMPKSIAATSAGALTAFLPCGHLYSFFIGAIATGSALGGATFMFAFWLGSTPILSFGSLWFRDFIAKGPRNAQRIAGAILVSAGLFSILTFSVRALELYKTSQSAAALSLDATANRCH